MYMWVVSEPNQTQTNPNKNQTKEKVNMEDRLRWIEEQ